jgi:uncharacterized protein (TIGR03435 family)
VNPPANPDHQPLLQKLLADRFALKFHWETRELPVYALVVDKSGAILKENRDARMTILNTRRGAGTVRIVGTKISMEELARSIGTEPGRVVVDKTELRGGFRALGEDRPWMATAANRNRNSVYSPDRPSCER